MSNTLREQKRSELRTEKNISNILDTFINNQNILAQVPNKTDSYTEDEILENQKTIYDFLANSIDSSSLKGDAYSSAKTIKKEIESIEKQISNIDKGIALDIRNFKSTPVPLQQQAYRKSIEKKEEQKAKLIMLRNAKIQEFGPAFTSDQVNVENAFIHSEYPTSSTTNNNNNTVSNNNNNKNNNGYEYDPNNILFKQGTTDEDLAKFEAAVLDLLNTSKSISPFSPKYKAENFLLGGGQWLYDKMLEKAKSQGEDPTEAFLKDSDTIRGYLEKISANPEIMALVEIAAQQGIKSDDQMLSLIFDLIEFDHDNITRNDFNVSAEKTLQGIQNIKQGNFDTEAARRIIDRLRLKGKEEQLANSLILGSGR